MERNITLLLVLGSLITLILLFVNIYLAGIVVIILITLLMSLMIMQDTKGHPDIAVQLRDDAKGIILTNKGNARADAIHGALVPMNIEFDIPFLDADATYEYPFPAMVEEVKVAITYKNEAGNQFSKTAKLSSLEEEPDLLKPMIPVFKWKK
jgi:hypothetical protein